MRCRGRGRSGRGNLLRCRSGIPQGIHGLSGFGVAREVVGTHLIEYDQIDLGSVGVFESIALAETGDVGEHEVPDRRAVFLGRKSGWRGVVEWLGALEQVRKVARRGVGFGSPRQGVGRSSG